MIDLKCMQFQGEALQTILESLGVQEDACERLCTDKDHRVPPIVLGY